jgi:DNA end-binding protein Ku
VRKGFETDTGQLIAFTPEEVRSLDLIESARAIDLATFVPQAQLDPLYFDAPLYLHPDGETAIEAYQVIAAAMTESGTAGIGRVAIRRRGHMALVMPRDGGMALFTLRAAEEVLPAEFPSAQRDLDPEMIAVAKAIIERRSGTFDPSTFRDPRSEALRQLAEAKLKGDTIITKKPSPSPVHDLMETLRRSLAEVTGEPASAPRLSAVGDQRQRNLLLPVSGNRGSGRHSAKKAGKQTDRQKGELGNVTGSAGCSSRIWLRRQPISSQHDRVDGCTRSPQLCATVARTPWGHRLYSNPLQWSSLSAVENVASQYRV